MKRNLGKESKKSLEIAVKASRESMPGAARGEASRSAPAAQLSEASAEAAEALKAEGNALFKAKKHAEARDKYSWALGGGDSSGDGLAAAVSMPLLLNRAACHLELADGADSAAYGNEKLQHYYRAIADADQARGLAEGLGGGAMHAKALCRLGRAQLGACLQKEKDVNEKALEFRKKGKLHEGALLDCRLQIANGVNGLDTACMHLQAALDLAPGDRMVMKHLLEGRELQARLTKLGAPPRSMSAPEPARGVFAPEVVFTAGSSWMANQVACEVPISPKGRRACLLLPVALQKQANTNNGGELVVWIMYSDHLGRNTLTERALALGIDPKYDGRAGNAWGNLSIPCRRNELEAAEEFVLALDFNQPDSGARGVPDALEAAGVIERVRNAGATGAEARLVYRVKF